MKRIIITGNIGSGKSGVCDIFKQNGYKVISADKISDKILRRNQKTVSKMFKIRPIKYNSFKKELGKMVFGDSNSKKILEEFMLYLINEEIDKKSKKYEKEGKKFITEMPTFFEIRGLSKHKEFIVVLVEASKEIRIQRIQKRNPLLSLEDINNRINSQIDNKLKRKYADEIIVNNLNIEELSKKIDKLIVWWI